METNAFPITGGVRHHHKKNREAPKFLSTKSINIKVPTMHMKIIKINDMVIDISMRVS